MRATVRQMPDWPGPARSITSTLPTPLRLSAYAIERPLWPAPTITTLWSAPARARTQSAGSRRAQRSTRPVCSSSSLLAASSASGEPGAGDARPVSDGVWASTARAPKPPTASAAAPRKSLRRSIRLEASSRSSVIGRSPLAATPLTPPRAHESYVANWRRRAQGRRGLARRQACRAVGRQVLVDRREHHADHHVVAHHGHELDDALLAEELHGFGVESRVDLVLAHQVAPELDDQCLLGAEPLRF